MKLQLTPEQIQDLAAEIVVELREWAFEGDEWISNRAGVRVVAAALTKWETK